MVKFEGFDWSELSEKWQCVKDSDDECLEATKYYMSETLGDPKLMAKCAKDIRSFLTALIDAAPKAYDVTIWKGLLKIKKRSKDLDSRYADEVLIKYTIELLGCMWS